GEGLRAEGAWGQVNGNAPGPARRVIFWIRAGARTEILPRQACAEQRHRRARENRAQTPAVGSAHLRRLINWGPHDGQLMTDIARTPRRGWPCSEPAGVCRLAPRCRTYGWFLGRPLWAFPALQSEHAGISEIVSGRDGQHVGLGRHREGHLSRPRGWRRGEASFECLRHRNSSGRTERLDAEARGARRSENRLTVFRPHGQSARP